MKLILSALPANLQTRYFGQTDVRLLLDPDLSGWRAAGEHLAPGSHSGALPLLREPLCMYKVSILGVFEYFLSLYPG